tara:strand:- start:23772 stop:24341 length:570 start_codon:yes stop_codon:yes gene_type:complete
VGRVARLISFVRATSGTAKTSDVTVDRGGQDNRTPQHFSDPGDDSFPLPTDFTHLEGQAGTGRDSVVGYVDPKNLQKSTSGDKRIYARDASGDQVVEVWLKSTGDAVTENGSGSVELKADGSITGTNSAGSFSLQAGGNFVVNGVIIDASGNVTIPTSLTLNGKELADHSHSQGIDSGGNTEQDTGTNN